MIDTIARSLGDVQKAIRLKSFRYQEQNSTQTLREALQEYHSGGDLYRAEVMTPESRRFFEAHDACHVVFGCATTPEHEAIVTIWTLFGSTFGLKDYLAEGARPDQAETLMEATIRRNGTWRMAFLSVVTLPDVFAVLKRTREMRKKWGTYEFKQYLDTPLWKIREEFNIRLYPG